MLNLTVNETFDPCDVTAPRGSHLLTSSFVRRLQCVLVSVIYSVPHCDDAQVMRRRTGHVTTHRLCDDGQVM